MPSFKESLKKVFNGFAPKTQEYNFENGGKTAKVTTKQSFLSSSYSVKYNDGAGTFGEQTGFALLKNVTAQGVKKGKDFCGIT